MNDLDRVRLMAIKSVRDSIDRGVGHTLRCSTCELTSFASAIHRALVDAAMFVLSITTFLPSFKESIVITNSEAGEGRQRREIKASLKRWKRKGYEKREERGGRQV